MSIASACLLVFLLLSVALCAVYVALYGSYRGQRNRFVESALKFRTLHGDQTAAAESPAQAWLSWAMERMPEARDSRATGRAARLLIRAGIYRESALTIFRLIRLGSAVGAGLVALGLGYLFGHRGSTTLFAGMGGALLGLSAPPYLLGRRARARQRKIALQLSDVLDLLVVCVEAGLGLFEAIKVVGQETERQGQEIGTELMLVSGEVAAGNALGQALRALAERTAVEDLRPLASTLIQSEQLGAQIGPALRSSSDMLRIKRRLRAEEAAQKTVIKILFPLVLFILPAMLLVILAPALIQAIHTFTN